MRAYMREILNAWEQGKPLTRPSASTDGKNIYSYGTIILRGATDDGRPHTINETKYSPTTSTQQHAIRVWLGQYGYEEVTGIPMGAKDF